MSIAKYIMLADDDADDRMLFEEAVKEVNDKIKFISSVDGAEFMHTLIEIVPPEPDIIFLDINMPKKNGFECLKQIRSSPVFKNIPVIMYSTSAQDDAVNKAFEAGANFYVKKPDNFSTLKLIIEKIVSINFNLMNLSPDRDSFIITL